MNKATASLRDRWLGIHGSSSYKKKEADHPPQEHLQVLQQFHRQQQQQQQQPKEDSRRRRPQQQQQQHWDLRPFGVNWEAHDDGDDESTDSPPLLRSWQTADEWLPSPKPLAPPPPPPPPSAVLFPMTPRQQQQQLASIHRSQQLAAMLTKDQSYSSVRLKHSRRTVPLVESSHKEDNQEDAHPTDHDDDEDDEEDGTVASPPRPNATLLRTKRNTNAESSHRRILQLAPMHSRPQPPQPQPPPVPGIKPSRSTKPKALRNPPPPVSNKPTKFSYPAYWSDNEGRKLDIYQRSMLRLQEREKRLEQRRQELAKENCTFVPKLRNAVSASTNHPPTTPLAAAVTTASTNHTTHMTTSVSTTPPSAMATTPTTTETTTTTTTTSSSTSTTAGSKATVASPTTVSSKETVFERLYRQQSKQATTTTTTRPVRKDPPKVTAPTTTKTHYSWTSNSTSRPGTDGNNSWVSSSMSSKIDYLDGLAKRNSTGTTGTRSDSEAKLLRRRRLEEREMAECTFHPRTNWKKDPKANGGGPNRIPTKTPQNVSPLSDGEGSKDTMTRRAIQVRHYHQPAAPVKRLPREIVTTTIPSTSHSTAPLHKQGRAPPVVSPLRDPPVTVHRRSVAEPKRTVPSTPPMPVSPLRVPPVTESNKRGVGRNRTTAVKSPPRPERHQEVESSKQVGGGGSHRPSVASPRRDSPERNKAAQRDIVRNPPVLSPARGRRITLISKQTVPSGKWVGGSSHQPPVASPRYDSPMTLERKKAAELRKTASTNARQSTEVSPLPVSPKTQEQDTVGGVYVRYPPTSPIRDLPVVSMKQNRLTETTTRGGGGSHQPTAVNAVRGTSVAQERTKRTELSSGGGHHHTRVRDTLRGSAGTLNNRGSDTTCSLRGNSSTMENLESSKRNRIGTHHPVPVSPLRGSPTTLERPREKPAPPTSRGRVLDNEDDEDDAILPPVLPRRTAAPYSFRPVMDVPRVIYSESLASESVVSGRTVDTEYGSI